MKEVVLRIFLAPIRDETGRRLSLREHHLLMIELDKFVEKGIHVRYIAQ